MESLQPKTLKILSNLSSQVAKCKKCSLGLTRNKTVFQSGNPMADLVIVGERPEDEENASGVPFSGDQGKLLDRILATIGRDRSSAYLMLTVRCQSCDIVPWGRKNRPPTAEELTACSDWFDSQMNALPNKQLILAFGGTAANRAIGRFEEPYPLYKLRFKYISSGFENSGKRIPVVSSYHLGYLNKNAEEKIKTYNDILFAKKFLDATPEQRDYFGRSTPEEPPRREEYALIQDTRKWGFVKPFQADVYSEKIEPL
jgi:DNA polymerase